MILKIGDFSAVTIEVVVNGNKAGYIPWKDADGLDMNGLLEDGINRIDIEVMGSPRNLFGPFHQAVTNDNGVSWISFRREGME